MKNPGSPTEISFGKEVAGAAGSGSPDAGAGFETGGDLVEDESPLEPPLVGIFLNIFINKFDCLPFGRINFKMLIP